MRVALLEDDAVQRAYLVSALRQYLPEPIYGQLVCSEFDRGEELRRILRRETYDLLILDWNLPDVAGVDVLRWIRDQDHHALPVMLVSARSAEQDVVHALQEGADDYVIKPLRAAEFGARVARLLWRRYHRPSDAPLEAEHVGGWVFDHAKLTAAPQDQPAAAATRLTDREFRLATVLFRNMGRPVSRSHLLHAGGQNGEECTTRTLDTHVYRIRGKLKLVERGLALQSVYGQGYRLHRSATVARSDSSGTAP